VEAVTDRVGKDEASIKWWKDLVQEKMPLIQVHEDCCGDVKCRASLIFRETAVNFHSDTLLLAFILPVFSVGFC